jgi:hypothetical protein
MSTQVAPELPKTREGAGEVKLLSVLVAGLLVAGYASWTKKDTVVSAEKVTLSDVKGEALSGVVLVTRTQTVSIARRAVDGREVSFFEIDQAGRKRGFKANKQVSALLDGFGPFEAVRSLGALEAKQLDEVKLTSPQAKLILRVGGKDKVFELGTRTFGTRDWYVRAAGGREVYVVASKVIGDFEYPEGRFMQRQLRDLAEKDVSKVVLKAGGRERTFVHQNRLSEKDAFWAKADAPDQRDETIDNYLHKLDGLTATQYVEPAVVAQATPVLSVSWFEDDKPKESLDLVRAGGPGVEKYYVTSTATALPVEVPSSSASQLEQDLATILAD